VLTVGDRGSVALTDADEVLTHAAHDAREVDRFGRGDAFMGGLIWGLLEEGDARFALAAANAAAALKTSTFGDHFTGSAADVRAMVDRTGSGIDR
jgi:sugar/nucleoside kinase (ribokinase family)